MALVESVSGVRGIYGKELTGKVAYHYAKSYLSFLLNKKNKSKSGLRIIIGMDTRMSGPILKNAVSEALNCEIIDLGIASTPMVELAVRHYKADGGIIITSSHNEPYWNGFKFLQNNGGVLDENNMDLVINNYKKNQIKKVSKAGISSKKITYEKDIVEEYSNFVLGIIGKENIEKIKKQKIKFIMDPNGGTGISAKKILDRMGIQAISINMEQGQFKRVIEPNAESLFYLTSIIKENNCEFAAGFDCDADRVEIIMKDGSMVSGHYLLALTSYYYLKYFNETKNENRNKIIVVNDATSYIVRDVVKNLGGKIIETGVGEANVVEEIYRKNALIGGEGSSGGVIIPPSRCRDGILSLLTILSLMANENKTLAQLVKQLPQYFTISKKISYDERYLGNIKKKILKYYSKKGHKIAENHGSIKVILSPKSFIWFRESKTESGILRIIADSNNQNISKDLITEAQKLTKNLLQ